MTRARLAFTAAAVAVNLAATAELLLVVELAGRPVFDVWLAVLARVVG